MSANIQLLKEKLKQQKEKDQRKIHEVKIQKQKVMNVPVNPKTVKTKIDEESLVRQFIKNFLEENYTDAYFLEENKSLKEKVVRKKWRALSNEQKLEYSLKSLLKKAPAGRVKFIMELLKLPESMRDSFLKSYLEQPRNYSTYFELWSQDNKKKIADNAQESKEEIVETETKPKEPVEISKNRAAEIVNELVNKMIEYGKENIPDSEVLETIEVTEGEKRSLKRDQDDDEEEDEKEEKKKGKDEKKTVKRRPGYYRIIDEILTTKKKESLSPKERKKIEEILEKRKKKILAPEKQAEIDDILEKSSGRVLSPDEYQRIEKLMELSPEDQEKINKVLIHSPDKRKKLHARIARDYIKIAEILEIENAADLEIAQLAAKIAAREKTLQQRSDYADVMNMERKKLVKKVKLLEGENLEDLSDYMLKLMYLQQQKNNEEFLRRSSSSVLSSSSKSAEKRTVKKANLIVPSSSGRGKNKFVNALKKDDVEITSRQLTPKEKKKVRKSLVKLAKFLSIENADELSLEELESQIYQVEKDFRQREDYNKVMNMKIEKLVKKLKKEYEDFDFEGASNRMLRIMYFLKFDSDLKESSSRSSSESPRKKENWVKLQKKRERNVTRDILNKILSENVTSRSIDMCAIIVINSTGLPEEYVRTAINILGNKLKDRTNQQLFEEVAKFLAYYSLPMANSFRTKVNDGYFIPDFLFTLSPKEMLPEIYMTDVSDESENSVTEYLKNSILKKRDMIAEKYYRFQDSTAKVNTKIELEKSLKIKYSANACVNKEDMENIPVEKLLFYKDNAGKVYCFNRDDIQENFTKRDFINPVSKEPFSKKFISKYIITYIDPIDQTIQTFPYTKLIKQFKKENFINENTGRPFDDNFIQSILQNTYYKPQSSLTGKFSQTLTKCENFDDVVGEDVRNVLFYNDKKNKKLYCFTIESILENKDGVNKLTGEPFSEKFLETVKKYKIPEKKESEEVSVKKEDVMIPKQELIVSNLWSLITDSLKENAESKEENNSDEESQAEEDKSDEDKSEEDSKEDSASEESKSEEDPMDYMPEIPEDYTEDDVEKLFAKSLKKYAKASGITDKDELYSVLKIWKSEGDVEIKSKVLKTIAEEVSEKLSEKMAEKSAKMGFEGNQPPKDTEIADSPKESPKESSKEENNVCHKCKKPLNKIFKTVIMIDEKPEIVSFCSTNCIEEQEFPSHRKVKQRKRKSA